MQGDTAICLPCSLWFASSLDFSSIQHLFRNRYSPAVFVYNLDKLIDVYFFISTDEIFLLISFFLKYSLLKLLLVIKIDKNANTYIFLKILDVIHKDQILTAIFHFNVRFYERRQKNTLISCFLIHVSKVLIINPFRPSVLLKGR